jgi:hypothetical protein
MSLDSRTPCQRLKRLADLVRHGQLLQARVVGEQAAAGIGGDQSDRSGALLVQTIELDPRRAVWLCYRNPVS